MTMNEKLRRPMTICVRPKRCRLPPLRWGYWYVVMLVFRCRDTLEQISRSRQDSGFKLPFSAQNYLNPFKKIPPRPAAIISKLSFWEDSPAPRAADTPRARESERARGTGLFRGSLSLKPLSWGVKAGLAKHAWTRGENNWTFSGKKKC